MNRARLLYMRGISMVLLLRCHTLPAFISVPKNLLHLLINGNTAQLKAYTHAMTWHIHNLINLKSIPILNYDVNFTSYNLSYL